MKRVAFVALFGAFLSLFFLPRSCAVILALVATPIIPGAPLLIGALADVLYLPPGLHALPLLTLIGAALSALTLFVRSRLTAGIIA